MDRANDGIQIGLGPGKIGDVDFFDPPKFAVAIQAAHRESPQVGCGEVGETRHE